ncbi:helix-turn-helix transcriptional regulator [Thalassobacter stenotrophicus]|uniref:helix-turn-helix transcriptional regulator n=1 Tax=Thalassobacter stenotrophicus TaxID=266809 RepID=UPI000D5D800D|nr:AlpA family phage regulatory protein [Thalassobacter stenotrophicus]PVZ45929.1 hypothetical protein DD557_16975 [Thalassobacter stenotrophicus]
METFIRLAALSRHLGLSELSIRRMVKAETFPKPYRVGVRAVAWKVEEIDAWVATRKVNTKTQAPLKGGVSDV